MLLNAEELRNFDLVASDGEIGSILGFYVDIEQWDIHYLLVDSGNWLPGRKVIISPDSIEHVDHNANKIHLSLTKDRIRNSPEVNQDEPLDQLHESRLKEYYGWAERHVADDSGVPSTRRKLYNTTEIKGNYLYAIDGDIGHVEDFIVDDETMLVRYIIVDTRNWLPGRKVLIAPTWLSEVDWQNKKISTDLTRASVKDSPEYDKERFDQEYEDKLFRHYGQDAYRQDRHVIPDNGFQIPII